MDTFGKRLQLPDGRRFLACNPSGQIDGGMSRDVVFHRQPSPLYRPPIALCRDIYSFCHILFQILCNPRAHLARPSFCEANIQTKSEMRKFFGKKWADFPLSLTPNGRKPPRKTRNQGADGATQPAESRIEVAATPPRQTATYSIARIFLSSAIVRARLTVESPTRRTRLLRRLWATTSIISDMGFATFTG